MCWCPMHDVFAVCAWSLLLPVQMPCPSHNSCVCSEAGPTTGRCLAVLTCVRSAHTQGAEMAREVLAPDNARWRNDMLSNSAAVAAAAAAARLPAYPPQRLPVILSCLQPSHAWFMHGCERHVSWYTIGPQPCFVPDLRVRQGQCLQGTCSHDRWKLTVHSLPYITS